MEKVYLDLSKQVIPTGVAVEIDHQVVDCRLSIRSLGPIDLDRLQSLIEQEFEVIRLIPERTTHYCQRKG